MGLKANICQVCGGALKNCGTYYKCVCCDTEYRIDDSMTKEEINAYFRKLNAFEDAERNLQLDCPRFDEAESEFGLIVQKYPDWSAGYWGLVRAKFGIKFEQDSGGKAIPSCYKSTYEDFRNTDEYKKAIALVETPELRQSYEKMAEYIARVAKEWRAEAQKYDYDVFISFKASNDLDGSETRDAREMHKLYDLLKDKGYRVFFSPVTLITDGVVGKGSEPYIFNALDKAKALVVYGSRKEYFSSAWVQNEWQRYLRAMKACKKEKDSLLVLYEGFNPKELPQGLRRIQGIEYGISAYPAVLAALERVFRKEDAARDRKQELRRAEEEKRKAEQENAQKMQDMMAQLAAMQAELARLKAAQSVVPQSDPITNTSVSATAKENKNPQPKKTVAKVTKSSIAKTSQPQSAPISREVVVLPAPTTNTFASAMVKQNKNSQQKTASTKSIKSSVTKTLQSKSAPVPMEVVDPYHGQNRNDFIILAGILDRYDGTQSEVIVPDGVTNIGVSAFRGCKGIKSITLPNSVTGIGKFAFYGCSGLTSITFPNSVTSIGKFAFYGCSGLTSITFPNSVTSIEDSAFSGCSGLTSITFPNSVTSIGNSAFSGCSGLTSITLPNSVQSIGDKTFSGCSGLASISIPNSVWSIGDYAFSGCSGLTSITIPNSVRGIEYFAFLGCDSLQKAIVPKKTEVDLGAFPNSTKIERY